MDKTQPAPDAAPFGLALFLVSLGVLFAASLIGYAAVRTNAPHWPPPGTPSLPPALWISTLFLIVSSGTMHWALRSVRAGKQKAFCWGMILTSVLGTLFLVAQALNWIHLARVELTASSNLYGFTFYMLTGLHAVHVVGGLIPLWVTTARGFRERYSQGSHQGVLLCSMYWHFLDAVWLVIFVTLALIR